MPGAPTSRARIGRRRSVRATRAPIALPFAEQRLYGAPSMRPRLLLPLAFAVLAPLPLVLLLSACNEVPRGEQGIDFLVDGSSYTVPPGHDAGTDARPSVPCAEEMGSSATCAQASSGATPARHLIVCADGGAPAGIVCVAGPDAATDAGTFCCTTGLL